MGTINVTTPSRIDLAGGTVDIFPLYILEGEGMTVNAAINLYAKVILRERDDKTVVIRSVDLNREIRARDTESLKLSGKLDFLVRFAKYFNPGSGFELETECLSPPGSGLGTSSSLGIAVSAAFMRMANRTYNKIDLVNLATNIEVQCIRTLTGKQDQIAAAFGGFNAIHFAIDGDKVERLDADKDFMKELRDRMVLCFTGKSHSSAKTNWGMVKNYIENRGSAVRNIRGINKIAFEMRDAVLSKDVDIIARTLDKEWKNRRQISKGVSTPHMEKIIKAGKRSGAIAAKATGAGGGGSIVMFTKDGKREEVERALESVKGEVLDFKFDMNGIKVKRS
jgi:D-glycero-alpha-D-manno-heptose-7-phosphate kinase